jgi:amidase
MSFAEYSDYDGLGLADLVKRKKVKPAELVEAAMELVERHNPQLNAIVFKAYDEARAKATARLSGTFAGVPMLLKDILGDKKGWPTRSGARFVPATPAPLDATLVARFEAAGLIPLGKTNVPEFGLVPLTEPKLYGPARNPWDLDYSTGGCRVDQRPRWPRASFRSRMPTMEVVRSGYLPPAAASSVSSPRADAIRLGPCSATSLVASLPSMW